MKQSNLSAKDFANCRLSSHFVVVAKPADRCPYTSIERAPSKQCSKNSSFILENIVKLTSYKLSVTVLCLFHFVADIICLLTLPNIKFLNMIKCENGGSIISVSANHQ